jgi:IS30 family transposase
MSHHITTHQRAALAALLRAGLNQEEAACELGKDSSAVSRELRRNPKEDGTYDARIASKKARERRKNAKKSSRMLENDPALAAEVIKLLHRSYSPEQAAVSLGTLSHKAIYSWIKRSRTDLQKYLRRRGKKRRRYGTKPLPSRYQAAKRPLAERPARASNRSRIGDWEGDTARGGNRKSALLVFADRKSRYLLAAPLERAPADAVRLATKRLFRTNPVHTITFDNGSEFALHRSIEEDLRIKVYFARPGHPEERGTNENGIGLLREFFPKGTDFHPSLQPALTRALHLINHRPRKVLGWKTACQIYKKACCV